MKDIELFSYVAGDRKFQTWLENQLKADYARLARATEEVGIHRLQGRILLMEEIQEYIAKAKGLR